jgi:putative RecB family exonuclease
VAQAIHGILNPYQVANPDLGPSKIATYLKCPREYKIRYVDKLTASVNAPAALGSAVHSVIAYGHSQQWSRRNADDAAGMLEAVWEGIEPVGKRDPDMVVAYRQARDAWLPWYLRWQEPQDTIVVEERWEANVPEELDGGLEEPIRLTGTIDRVYVDNPEGVPILSDIKSGARAPNRHDLATHLQLSLYAWAFRCVGARDTHGLELVHLRGGCTYRTTRTDEYLAHVLRMTVVPVALAIRAGSFPAHPGSLYGCRYCTVHQHCPVGRPAGNGDEHTHGCD